MSIIFTDIKNYIFISVKIIKIQALNFVALTLHCCLYLHLSYGINIMKMKNVSIKLASLTALYLTNISAALAGLPTPVPVPEPSVLSLVAVAGIVAFILHKRKK